MAVEPVQPFIYRATRNMVARCTGGSPRRTSVLDWIMAITSTNEQAAAEMLNAIIQQDPTVQQLITIERPYRGDPTPTPMATAVGLFRVVRMLPDRYVAEHKRELDELMIRYLGGDTSLISEVNRTHWFQNQIRFKFGPIFHDTAHAYIVHAVTGVCPLAEDLPFMFSENRLTMARWTPEEQYAVDDLVSRIEHVADDTDTAEEFLDLLKKVVLRSKMSAKTGGGFAQTRPTFRQLHASD